jgi:hypothetical protein
LFFRKKGWLASGESRSGSQPANGEGDSPS